MVQFGSRPLPTSLRLAETGDKVSAAARLSMPGLALSRAVPTPFRQTPPSVQNSPTSSVRWMVPRSPGPTMRARALKALLVASACTITLTGCPPPEDERVAEASRKLAEQLAQADSGATGSTPAPPKGAAGGETRLYVDASRSMAGFVGCRTTETEFDQVLDRIATALEITEVQLFGTTSPGVPLMEERKLDHSVHCPDTFRRLQNPDRELYAMMEADSTARIHLYFSDGVQSDARAANPSASVRELQRWLANGRALAILAFRGRFSGEAWSEQRGAWMGPVDVPDRPFYVFVLAPSEKDVDETLAKLSPSLRPEATLRFPSAPFSCSIRRRVAAQRETSSPPWALVPPSVHRQMAENPAHVADYACTIRDGYPVRAVEAALAANYRRWDGQDFGAEGAVPESAMFTLGKPAQVATGAVTPLHGTVPHDQPGTLFGFYHLRLTPRRGVFTPELESLSTDSDADKAQFNRTYRFSWLVEHLVRSQFMRNPRSASLFLTIQDGG
ncbi:MAG TPA: hypothetical protein VF006_27065 [Longimicrobium sp.]